MQDPLECVIVPNANDNIMCRICLGSNKRMYNINNYNLLQYYEDIINKKQLCEDLPNYLCYECAILLLKYYKFKLKVKRGQECFRNFIKNNTILQDAIERRRKDYNLNSTLKTTNIKVNFNYNTEEKPEPIEIESDDDTEFTTNHFLDNFKIKLTNNLKLNVIKIVDTFTMENNTEANTEPEKIESDNDAEFTTNDFLDNFEIKLTNNLKSNARKKVDNFSMVINRKEKNNAIKTNLSTEENKKKSNSKIEIDLKKWKVFELNENDTVIEFNRRNQKYQNCLFTCDLCHHGFNSKDTLERHMDFHSEARGPFECAVCKKRFKWQTMLNRHMSQHTVSYLCMRCPKICSNPSQALVHEKYHDGIDYICKICGAKFLKITTYYSHVRLKHPSTFICTSCGLSFVSETGLTQHRTRQHHLQNTSAETGDELSCVECNVIFDNKEALENHLKHSTNHNITEKLELPNGELISCSKCEQRFKSIRGRKRHENRVHTTKVETQPEYICEICGASVARSSIWQHRNTHTRENVFPCNICFRKFQSPANRHRHMVTHTGEKPFPCELCDKRFTQRANLKLHFNTYHLKQPNPYERNRNRKRKRERNT